MPRQKKPEGTKCRTLSISLAPEVCDRLRALARDDRGRELAGGVSGVVRSIITPYLARQTRRPRKTEAAA